MGLEERAKRVEEVTKQAPEARHMMSVLVGIIDLEILKCTAQQGKGQLEKLKVKIQEFVKLITGSKSPDAMDIGRIEGREEGRTEEGGGEGGEEQCGLCRPWNEWGGIEGVNGVGELC